MTAPRGGAVVAQIGVAGPGPALGECDVVSGKARVGARRRHFVEGFDTRRERVPVQAGGGGRRAGAPHQPMEIVAALPWEYDAMAAARVQLRRIRTGWAGWASQPLAELTCAPQSPLCATQRS